MVADDAADQTRERYTSVLAKLWRVLVLFRSVEITGGGKTSKPVPPVVCGCGRKIRAGKTVLAEGPIPVRAVRDRIRRC